MGEIEEGVVVIVSTGQAGTCLGGEHKHYSVLLRNGDIWYGNKGQVRIPQSQEDLDAALIEFNRFADK